MEDKIYEYKGKYTGFFAGFTFRVEKGRKIKYIKLKEIKNTEGQYLFDLLKFKYDVRFKKAGVFKKGDLIYFEYRFQTEDGFSTWFVGKPSRIRKIESTEESADLRPVVRETIIDMVSLRAYVAERYNGDYSKLTQEEKEQFITLGDIIEKPRPVNI